MEKKLYIRNTYSIKKKTFNSSAIEFSPYIFLQSLVWIMYLVKQNKKNVNRY